MHSSCSGTDAAAELLERRWFAAFKAASQARAECEALLESISQAEAAWSSARVHLCSLEALRDALSDELEALNGYGGPEPANMACVRHTAA